MIQFMHGNLFDSGADILVNPVNCVGVMGKGIALEFKNRWPEMFFAYRVECATKRLRIGTDFTWSAVDGSGTIINIPTKRHWKDQSTYEDLEVSLVVLRARIVGLGKRWSVAIPALGCCNGGLDWARVKPMVVDVLGSLPNTIYVFEP
jgi:O-acetyl-ADP-ribose deacetylase (regulator of RNase III)